VEIHEDALETGEKVLVVDDVIATGGTARAVGELVRLLGAEVSAYAFLVELSFLNGRSKLTNAEVLSLIRYD
jgi:adenine phosphoribosyltransferase